MLLKNKEKFEIDLQLFAGEGDPEPPTDPNPALPQEPNQQQPKAVTMDVLEGVLKGFGEGIVEQIKGLIPNEPEPQANPTPNPTPQEPPKADEIPAYVKDLQEQIKNLNEQNKSKTNAELDNKKAEAVKKYGFEATELEGINDLTTLNTVINLAKKVEKNVEKQIPDILKKRGQEISDINKINAPNTRKIGGEEVNPLMAFFRLTNMK